MLRLLSRSLEEMALLMCREFVALVMLPPSLELPQVEQALGWFNVSSGTGRESYEKDYVALFIDTIQQAVSKPFPPRLLFCHLSAFVTTSIASN